MFENSNGKLLVYASSFSCRKKHMKSIRAAAEEMARRFELSFEVKTFREKFTPIYVYYKDGEEEPIPIYCNSNKKSSIEEICAALKNMMFVLSFHPRHSALRHVRNEIMQFS
jgi:hypothetical protein